MRIIAAAWQTRRLIAREGRRRVCRRNKNRPQPDVGSEAMIAMTKGTRRALLAAAGALAAPAVIGRAQAAPLRMRLSVVS
jgi:hypothetical protein